MDPTKRCPMCGELILRIAVRCKHCQADLRPAEHEFVATPPPPLGSYHPHPAYAAHMAQLAHLAQAANAAPPSPDPAPPQSAAFSHPTQSAAMQHPPAQVPHPNGLGGYVAPTDGTFEHRFLDFAFRTSLPINAATCAYAMKIAIDEADEGLQDLVARDVLLREVDERGMVSYLLPGRSAVAAITAPPITALAPYYAQPPQLLYDPPGALMTMPTENTALAGLLVNCCFPGLGSLIGGKTSLGVFQLLMFLIGIPLSIFIIGLPMLVGSWIWAVVTGVNMLNEAKQQTHRRMLAG